MRRPLLLAASLAALGPWLGACQPAPAPAPPADAAPPAEADLAGDLPAAADLRSADLARGGLPPGTSTITLNVAGSERAALLHVPAAPGPLPLVIALHGNGDTSDNFVRALRLEALADAAPFVLVAPQGLAQTITIGGQTVRVSWDAYRGAGQNLDLPLLDALRRRLVDSGAVDGRRVSLFGYSQGGYLAFRAGLDGARDLSCAAVCAAADPMPGAGLVAGAPRRLPVALQIGALDPALAAAQRARGELEAAGHPVQHREIAGAGHVPFPGDPRVPLDYCLGQTLP